MIKGLTEMGGVVDRARRALHFSGTDNLEQAVTWIVEHEEDKDLDEPLLIPQVLMESLLFFILKMLGYLGHCTVGRRPAGMCHWC